MNLSEFSSTIHYSDNVSMWPSVTKKSTPFLRQPFISLILSWKSFCFSTLLSVCSLVKMVKFLHIIIPHNSQTMFPIIAILVIMIQSSYCAMDNKSSSCEGVVYGCGNLQGIGHPFWGENRPESCGIRDFQLQCVENQTWILFDDAQKFRLLSVDPSAGTMTLALAEICSNTCPLGSTNISLPADGFLKYNEPTVTDLKIYYGCTSDPSYSNGAKWTKGPSGKSCCYQNIMNSTRNVCFTDESYPYIERCSTLVKVPVLNNASDILWASAGSLQSAPETSLQETINQGFDVEYGDLVRACSSCEASGGNCGSNKDLQVNCTCQGQIHPTVCPDVPATDFAPAPSPAPMNGNKRLGLIIAIAAGIPTIIIVISLIICCKVKGSIFLSFKRLPRDNKDIDDLIKQHGSLAPERYSYPNIKKMTNSFQEKLGEGGFGEVYKGNLFDDRAIAVKILQESENDGEDFFNEVLSISRTSHVNIVTLLGFCLDRPKRALFFFRRKPKRALVYEYMPNGSLEKYIHGVNPSEGGNNLGWETLHQIAVGIARGLEYLHKGCNTQILHFDIKPHNILLDENFCPKISDFGLAKLCTRKGGNISTIGARGTRGYIAPEFDSRTLGEVSHKSDVYSYGMMLIEMVGGRKNMKPDVSHLSQIYYPHWVYERMVLDEDLKLQGIKTQKEDEMARKMLLVGLWCIQNHPSKRPEINKVIEWLEGRLQDIKIPPDPFVGSLSGPLHGSLTTPSVTTTSTSTMF